MPIVFSATDRLAITRRQVKIAIENEALQSAVNSFSGQENALLEVDNGNKKIFDYYNNICLNYQIEATNMTGNIIPQFTNTDITLAAEKATGAPFFPTTPTPYTGSIPLISDGSLNNYTVKGFFHPSGITLISELYIISDTTNLTGLTQLENFLSSGLGGSGTTTTSSAVPSGAVTGLVLNTTLTTGFAVGDLVFIRDASAGGIYRITAVNPSVSLTVESIIPTNTALSGTKNIDKSLAGFSTSERQSLVGSTAPRTHLLNNIANLINQRVDDWETCLNNIITATTNNEDDRTPQASQIATALSTANADKATILSWKALPLTGITGRFTSSSMSIITGLMTSRSSFISTRNSQIATALGSTSAQALSQSGDTYSTSVPNNPYFNRYKWLNFRINRTVGSLRRYYSALQSKNTVDGFKQANLDLQNEYDNYFLTKPIIFNDGSDIVHIKNLTGLNVGDNVIIVSETQPEINRTIVQLMGTTQVKLNAPVPKTYTIDDLARIFKIL